MYAFQPIAQVFSGCNNSNAKTTVPNAHKPTHKLLHTHRRADLCDSLGYSQLLIHHHNKTENFPPQILPEFLLFLSGFHPHSLFVLFLSYGLFSVQHNNFCCNCKMALHMHIYSHFFQFCCCCNILVKVFFINDWFVGMRSQFERSFS